MSLVGFRAKNHPQQATVHHVDDRRTPLSLFGPLNADHRSCEIITRGERAINPTCALHPQCRLPNGAVIQVVSHATLCSLYFRGANGWQGTAPKCDCLL